MTIESEANMGARALALLKPLYDGLVLHVVAEHVNGRLNNLYTVAMHVSRAKVHTIPTYLERVEYGQFRCYRQLILEPDASALLMKLGAQTLALGSEEIHYQINPPNTGLCDASSDRAWHRDISPLPQRSMWMTRYAGAAPMIGAHALSERYLPTIALQLSFLKELRWRAVNLSDRPEAIGSLEVWYPSPLRLTASTNPIKIAVENHGFSATHRLLIRAHLYRDGLNAETLTLAGEGPHELQADMDSIDAFAFIDDILIDRVESDFTRQIAFNVGVNSGGSLLLQKPGRRAGTKVPLGPKSASSFTVGKASGRERSTLRALGKTWRRQHEFPEDTAEELYDPRDPDSILSALRGLQRLTTGKHVSHIVVVDRYSLNRDALEAIVALAVAHPAGVIVDILTKFDEAPGTGTEHWLQRAFDSAVRNIRKAFRASQPSPQQSLLNRISAFTSIARRAAKQFNIRIRLFKAEGFNLHDRFLLVDGRIWHVGPSFNAIGEALSGIVEMRTIKEKAHLLDMIEPTMVDAVFDSGDVT